MTRCATYGSARRFQGLPPPRTRGSHVSSAKVEIYTKWGCGYCYRAKALLDQKGVAYEEYDITMGGPKRAEMVQRAPGAYTVPQIFIDDRPIGGCDDLYALERAGKLDPMLSSEGSAA
ncbi:MAG: glutaredoxin 3 [Novosphingobium sp.]|nr:glutaredoxin 3 [Novosphingobium sp.]